MPALPFRDTQYARAAALVAFRSTENHLQSCAKLSELMSKTKFQDPSQKDALIELAERELRLHRSGMHDRVDVGLCQALEVLALSIRNGNITTEREVLIERVMSSHGSIEDRGDWPSLINNVSRYVDLCHEEARVLTLQKVVDDSPYLDGQIDDERRLESLEIERGNMMSNFGNGPFHDDLTRDRIAFIDGQIATIKARLFQPATAGNLDFQDGPEGDFDDEFEGDDDEYEEPESFEEQLASLHLERESLMAVSGYGGDGQILARLEEINEKIDGLERALTPPTRLLSLKKVGELRREMICGIVCLTDTDNEGEVRHQFLTQNRGLIAHQRGQALFLPESTVTDLAAYDLVNGCLTTVKPDYFTGTAHVVANLKDPDAAFEKRDGYLVLDTLAGALFTTHLPEELPAYAKSIDAIAGVNPEGCLVAVYPYAKIERAKNLTTDNEMSL